MAMSRMLLPLLFAAGLGGPANAGDIGRLYQSDAIVTGTGEINRQIGFRECLSEVLVKLSGDPTILDAPGFAALVAEAGSFASSFSYRDRLEGIPIHDEQGTHDRPHDLTCRYAPATIDPLLAKLGRKPWLAPRPVIAVLLAVEDQRRRFVLARDGDESPYMADCSARPRHRWRSRSPCRTGRPSPVESWTLPRYRKRAWRASPGSQCRARGT